METSTTERSEGFNILLVDDMCERSTIKKEKRILLVDDDESLVESFKSILEGEGYIVEKALTGQKALKKASKDDFDLAILDIVLPDIRGDKVASELKKKDGKINIILITGYPTFQDCIDTLKIGINEILLKPISPGELIKAVKEALTTQDLLKQKVNIVVGTEYTSARQLVT